MPGEDWKVEFSEQAEEAMSDDPEIAEFVRDTTSRMRQVLHDFEAGKFKDLDEALRSIGMTKVGEDTDEP